MYVNAAQALESKYPLEAKVGTAEKIEEEQLLTSDSLKGITILPMRGHASSHPCVLIPCRPPAHGMKDFRGIYIDKSFD